MRRPALFALIACAAALAAAPAAALGHGGEEEALEKTPARALVQQALALLSQENKAVEAHERVEAALKSKDREGVDLAALRKTQGAFDRGDHATARRLLNAALATPREEPMAGEEGGEHAEEGGAAEPARPAAGALEHTPEFEPERGTAEWIALAAGIVAILLGGVALLRARRPRAA